MILICLTISILSLVLFIRPIQKLDIGANIYENLKHKFVLIGNMLWVLSLIILLIGIVYPIYCSYFYKVEIAIDPEYYYTIFIPIIIPLLFLTAISPKLSKYNIKKHVIPNPRLNQTNGFNSEPRGAYIEIGEHGDSSKNRLDHLKMGIGIIHIVPATLVTFAIYNITILSIISALITFFSIYLITQMLDFLLLKTNYFTKYPNNSNIALFLGHFGFGMLALSINLNTIFSSNIEFIGAVNHQVNVGNISVKLCNIKFADGPNYFRQIAEFSVHDSHNNIVTLKPENRLYKIENSISAEADIHSYLTHDLYAVLSKVDGRIIHAQIYYRPFISFIWFSVFLIAAGFAMIHFSPRKMQKH